jgi:NAD+ synthase (glutamine-hydrolysing)
MRIAVAQINTTLGNFQKNTTKIIEYIKRAEDRHCDLIVFPESTIFGYHPFDMLELKYLVPAQLKELAKVQRALPKNMAAVVGVITQNKSRKGRPYFNSAVVLEKNKKPRFFNKQLLPTGDVFDEARFIENGSIENNFFSFQGKKIFLTICEDIWAWPDEKGNSIYLENPIQKLRTSKVDLVLNLSASPYYPGKIKVRRKLVHHTAKRVKAPMIYCNLVGAQDEIIFDGASFAMSPSGKTLMQSVSFEEEMNILDLEKNQGGVQSELGSPMEEIRRALVLGIRDFCEKVGIKKVHLGLSGGVDSALVACLAVDAMGAGSVSLYGLPGPFNAPESLSLAKELAKNLGVVFKSIPIQDSYQVLKKDLDQALGIEEFGLVHENLQARIRGTMLMAVANSENSLLLTTGNKSEYAAGYSTMYGDMCGGLAPIGDLTKAQVYALCELYNQTQELIPLQIIERAPSAELRPNQKDQDSLPPYRDLDASVVRLVEMGMPVKTKTDQWLHSILLRTEFKRWQAPPILKVSRHSFGRGRRWPIAHQAN